MEGAKESTLRPPRECGGVEWEGRVAGGGNDTKDRGVSELAVVWTLRPTPIQFRSVPFRCAQHSDGPLLLHFEWHSLINPLVSPPLYSSNRLCSQRRHVLRRCWSSRLIHVDIGKRRNTRADIVPTASFSLNTNGYNLFSIHSDVARLC